MSSGANRMKHNASHAVNNPFEWTDTQRAMTLALTRLCIQVIQLPKCEETALKFAQVTLNAITEPNAAYAVDWLTDRLMQACIDLDANERRL